MEHFFRRADLLDPAVVHHHDAVGHFERFFLIVRHQNARDVNLVVQPAEPGPQALPHLGVERAERLVQQQHLAARRPAPGPARRAAAGRRKAATETACRGRRAAPAAAARGRGDRFPRSTAACFARPHAQAERHVLEHAHVAEQRVVLEHEADAALGGGPMGDVLVVEADARARVGVRRVEAGDDPQQRRLAGAAGPSRATSSPSWIDRLTSRSAW